MSTTAEPPPEPHQPLPVRADLTVESSVPNTATSVIPPGRPKGVDPRTAALKALDPLHGKKAVLIALAANILIGTIKLGAGLLGRQSSMLSEAAHSYADAVNSGFLFIGLKKGSRAADKTHPFGYGLETTLWAMMASLFMLLLAAGSIYLGMQRLISPQPMEWWGLSAGILTVSAILEMGAVYVAASAVLNERDLGDVTGWWGKVSTAPKHVRHIVRPTTRFVYYEDSVALLGTVVALVAITVSEFGDTWFGIPQYYLHYPDAIASMLIGLMILGLAVYLFVHNSRGLTGSSANPQVEQHIRQLVMGLAGVSHIHDLKTVDYGMSGIVVNLRVEVDPDTLVKDVDDLTERIRDRVQARIANVKDVLIEVLADETSVEWSSQFYRLIEQGREREVLKLREEQMLRNVFDFTQAVVLDIMIPRTDVDIIEVESTLNELMALIAESGHARIPVYEDDMDNVIGVIDVKDVVRFIHEKNGNSHAAFSLKDLVRKIDIYPETKLVSDLLEEFRRKKIQIAMIADEHGGFAGIVTLEDLLEEIVGEILDDDDEDIVLLEQPEPTQLVVRGRMEIDELNEQYSMAIPDEEYKTVGGFVFGEIGREPVVGDSIVFDECTFTVLEMDGHRVERIQIDSPAPFVQVSPEAMMKIPQSAAVVPHTHEAE